MASFCPEEANIETTIANVGPGIHNICPEETKFDAKVANFRLAIHEPIV